MTQLTSIVSYLDSGSFYCYQLALKSNHPVIVCCKKAFQISKTAISDLKYLKRARLSQIQCFVLVYSLCLFSDVAVIRKSLIFPEVWKEFPRIQNSRDKSSNLVCWVTCLTVILKNYIRHKDFGLSYVCLFIRLKGPPLGFWNWVDWRALVKY